MPSSRPSLETSLFLVILLTAAIVMLAWASATLIPALPGWLPWVAALAGVGLLGWYLPARILRPLGSLTNVLGAVRGHDLTIRARSDRGGVMSELAEEINRLADGLRARGLGIRQSDALLTKLMQEIDLPILTFNSGQRLAAANPAAEQLCGTRLEAGVAAHALGVEELLDRAHDEPVKLELAGGAGRFLVRRRPFRIDGEPHTLLVLTEVGDALGAERREAWQSLVRVLGHEINNSLAPIKSISQTLLSANDGLDATETREGLGLIASRAEALDRFVGGYAALARLPMPRKREFELADLMGRVADLETRVEVVAQGRPMTVSGDADQLEQALINLVKNAGDAVADDDGDIRLSWGVRDSGICIEVIDNGPGPPESENLFVPFFTTKQGGSGVGLLLALRIAELHGGWLTLEHRENAQGAIARLWLPSH